MSLIKFIINHKVTVVTVLCFTIFVLFLYFLKPRDGITSLNGMGTEKPEADLVKAESEAYDEMMRKFDRSKENHKKIKTDAGIRESKVIDESKPKRQDNVGSRLKVVYEDEFSEDVVLPNGRVTPILKSNILGDSEKIEAEFKFEARDEQWAHAWESTLNNIVGSAGAQFNAGGYKVACKSKTCKIGVKLSENNPYGYDEAFRAMNKEFVLNEMKVVPGPIKEEGTEYIVYYYFPDGQPQ